MAAPPRRRIGALALVLVALLATAAPAGAGQIEEKRSEAAAIASRLEEQARSIVALDREHRRARDEVVVADAAVARAEADLASATRRQDDARRLLVVHAQAAYASGGTVTFLGRMARATVNDAAARRTYLRIAAGEDRQAIGRLQAAREDLEARRKSLADARKTAAGRAEVLASDLGRLDNAIAAQRALLATANGELARLVAAEQDRRDAEAARAAAARQVQAAAVAPATTAAPAPRAGAVTTVPRAPTTTAPTKPAPAASGDSVDETFACIRQLESGNNYKSPGGGAYQFLDSTWQSLGYSGSAQDHPPAVQDEAARRLLARDGWDQWSTARLCGRV
ncbi:MAG TPA: transglycosylase family protein [Acidimicrobiales bacterium]|nr:transglycosylase family protein [Acidimicrobiales bacterium]